MRARRDIVQDVMRRQRRFDRKANLAGMGPLGSCDGLLDGIESRGGEQHSRAPVCRHCMAQQASDLHYQLPEAPPPLNPPPPPLNPPPPPPPLNPPPPKPPPKPPSPPPKPP